MIQDEINTRRDIRRSRESLSLSTRTGPEIARVALPLTRVALFKAAWVRHRCRAAGCGPRAAYITARPSREHRTFDIFADNASRRTASRDVTAHHVRHDASRHSPSVTSDMTSVSLR